MLLDDMPTQFPPLSQDRPHIPREDPLFHTASYDFLLNCYLYDLGN